MQDNQKYDVNGSKSSCYQFETMSSCFIVVLKLVHNNNNDQLVLYAWGVGNKKTYVLPQKTFQFGLSLTIQKFNSNDGAHTSFVK